MPCDGGGAQDSCGDGGGRDAAAGGEAEANARLQAALDAERELALRERELSRTTTEQQTERAHLEQLDEVLVVR